jgi:hypothetical protein
LAGSTYKVNDGWDDVIGAVKGAPITDARKLRAANAVSSRMWTAFPWFDSLTSITASSIPIVDGTQDYTYPTALYRLTKCSIVRTDTSPAQHRELDVVQSLSVDLVKRGYQNIQSACIQPGVAKLRLEAALQVGTGQVLDIRGEYQANHTKLTDMTDAVWFRDQSLYETFIQGLTYWAYKYTDDPRAGGVTFSEGRAAYSGQLAAFMAALQDAMKAEDYAATDSFFPSESLSSGSTWNIPNIFPNT